MRVIKERHMKKWGYIIQDVEYDSNECGLPDGETMVLKRAITPAGDYIGDTKMAAMICKRMGISPEIIPNSDHTVCSIGFCEAEQKWYGWSHRAICGFGIGSHVKPGDCAYVPKDLQDFIDDQTRFWSDDYRLNVISVYDFNTDSVITQWKRSDDIENKALRGTIDSDTTEVPDEFGHGEWTAETLEDAKQMAIDFANGVS